MTAFKLEKELTPFFVAWLEERGFDVVPEYGVPGSGGICDLVGFRFAERVGRPIPRLIEFVAIELKLKRLMEVYEQARSNLYGVDRSWIGIPVGVYERGRPETRRLLLDSGVGILEISDDGAISELLTARPQHQKINDGDWRNYWRLVRRHRNRKKLENDQNG